ITLDTPYGQRVTTLVNEIGVYSLILGSKLPEAKAFKRWICKEVIPSIRSTGAYMTAETLAQVQDNPEALAELTTRLAEVQSKYQETLKLVEQHQKTIDQQGQLLERKNAYFVRNKPRIDFAKAVFDNQTAILVGEMAKLLAQNGIEIGQNRFFEWLRTHGYLQSKQGEMWNVPYQRCIERGLFIIKENVTVDNRGKEMITRTPMVTGKGQRYFISKFLETKDAEALAAITEEELRLQREDAEPIGSGADELEPMGNGADELEGMDGMDGIDGSVDDLEPIDGSMDELGGIQDEAGANNESLAAAAASNNPSPAYQELEAIA
ncbi:MAG: phage antirepressor KilAC domain-containing protein, partial [Phascolarctobacterium sp.]